MMHRCTYREVSRPIDEIGCVRGACPRQSTRKSTVEGLGCPAALRVENQTLCYIPRLRDESPRTPHRSRRPRRVSMRFRLTYP